MGLLEKLGMAKAPSLTEQINEVREAWGEQMQAQASMAPPQESWVEEVYDDHVIVCVDGDHYSVPYATDAQGEIAFDAASAVEVEQSWSEVTKTVVIEKTDPDRQLAFGWAYVMTKDGQQVVDHSGEFVDQIAVIEDAAYAFNLDYREGDEAHTEEVKAQLVESLVVTPEKLEKLGLAPDALPTGWWTGWHIPDPEMFAKVKDGTYPMLSIGGFARKEAVDA
jgi:hypothetical protein